MEDQTQILSTFLVNRRRTRRRRRHRTEYVRELFMNRNEDGICPLIRDLRNDPLYHYKYFRMDIMNFDWLLHRIAPLISHKSTHARPITALERLGLTIRYLASGSSQFDLATHYRMSPSSASVIIRETTEALISVLQKEFLPEPNQQIWEMKEKRFAKLWNFPNACGAVDGKHIRIIKPPDSGSLYYNYKNFFSIVLLAISDADYRFTCVDIGAYGSESDGGVLWRSEIGKKIQDGSLGLPISKPLSPTGSAFPHVLLGDDAFPLRTNMIKPYSGNFLNKESRIFNYRLSRARMPVENSFGILAARWRILHKPIDTDVEVAKKLVMCSVLLHNFLMSKNDYNDITCDRIQNGAAVRGNWRDVQGTEGCYVGLSRQGSNNHTLSATQVRDGFKSYFITDEGRVSWQDSYVDEGL